MSQTAAKTPGSATGGDWKLRDKEDREVVLPGQLQPGESKVFSGAALRPVLLANKGGLLVLLTDKGEHVDRIGYT